MALHFYQANALSVQYNRKTYKSGDTIVCWYDFMGVLCWWLSKLTNKKIKVIAINVLLKDKNTTKNKVAKYLYKKALCSNSFAATVTTVEYGRYINEILNTKVNFTLLHDVYHQNYTLNKRVETKVNTVFVVVEMAGIGNCYLKLRKSFQR